jgi:photosystem II stability/assembly factor-like uncharacterized protein
MSEDELIERLRRTLAERAAALNPTPAEPPALGADDWPFSWRSQAGTVPAGTVSTGPVPPEPTQLGPGALGREPGPDGPRTAEYTLISGPVPVLGRSRRRWAIATSAVLAAAAAVSLALVLPGRSHSITVQPAEPPPLPTTAPYRGQPGSPLGLPRTTAPTPATLPARAAPVPPGFEPDSVTFVSASQGWAAGWAPCPEGTCPTVATTSDGGRSWARTGSPTLLDAAGGGLALHVRFADPEHGWIWTDQPGASSPSLLYTTADGGRTWTPEANPAPGSVIFDLEASGGFVQLADAAPCATGTSSCQGQTVEEIFSTPAGAPHWTEGPVQPSIGAGPVPGADFTLFGTSGWLLTVNRTTVSGARIEGGRWVAWTPPCATANGAGYLAAASPSDLVAVCAEGQWGPPDPTTTAGRDWLFASSDGGSHFVELDPLPGDQAESVTVAPGSAATMAVADGSLGLLMSFDEGSSWHVALAPSAIPGGQLDFVGFTTATQGVAVAPGRAVFMTRDGGHTWQAVTF